MHKKLERGNQKQTPRSCNFVAFAKPAHRGLWSCSIFWSEL